MKTLIICIVGLGMAVGGFLLSSRVTIGFQETLAHQGIPLDLGKTLSMIGVLLLLFPVLDTFYFRPLKQAIDERTGELERTFSEAEQIRSEMATMKSDYEQRLAATESAAREQIQSQIREAQQLRSTLMAEASAKADSFLAKAREEIDLEKERAINDVRVRVVDMALAATEKVIGENVDRDRNRKLIEEFIERVEVPR